MSVAGEILELFSGDIPSEETVLNQGGAVSGPGWPVLARLPHGQQVRWLLDHFPNEITRRDVLALSDGGPTVIRRRVGTAALMWGYGVSGLRLGEDVVDAFSALMASSFDQLLEECELDLRRGDISAAYRRFVKADKNGVEHVRFNRLGPVFFSKILYFMGRRLEMAHYPLILDVKVAKTLSWLTGYRLFVRTGQYLPRADSDAYVRYVQWMHAWADEQNVSADSIEHFLWSNSENETLWEACVAAHQRQLS
jgi:hypothetical protein